MNTVFLNTLKTGKIFINSKVTSAANNELLNSFSHLEILFHSLTYYKFTHIKRITLTPLSSPFH